MPQLTEEQKVKLDSNIKNMLANGATNEQVVAYANDFKNKFSTVLKPTGETADGIPTVTIQEKVNVTEPQKVKQPSNPIIKSALINEGVYDSPSDDFRSIYAEQKAAQNYSNYQTGGEDLRNSIAKNAKNTLTNYYESKIAEVASSNLADLTPKSDKDQFYQSYESNKKREKDFRIELDNNLAKIDAETRQLNLIDNLSELKEDFDPTKQAITVSVETM